MNLLTLIMDVSAYTIASFVVLQPVSGFVSGYLSQDEEPDKGNTLEQELIVRSLSYSGVSFREIGRNVVENVLQIGRDIKHGLDYVGGLFNDYLTTLALWSTAYAGLMIPSFELEPEKFTEPAHLDPLNHILTLFFLTTATYAMHQGAKYFGRKTYDLTHKDS